MAEVVSGLQADLLIHPMDEYFFDEMEKSLGEIYKTHKKCTEGAMEPKTFAHTHDGFLDAVGKEIRQNAS